MRGKGIVFIISYLLFYIIFNYQSFAMWEDEKGFIPSFIQKCYSCWGVKKKRNEDEREAFIVKDASYALSSSIIKSQIEDIDQDIFNIINDKTSLVDKIYLSMTSKTLNKKFSDKYWENYIKVNSLKKWDSFIPAVKVAYTYYLFQQEEVEKAAQLGLPEAINSLKRKKEVSPTRKKYISFEGYQPYASSYFREKLQTKYY